MTPGARVAAAIGILDAVLDGQPAEQALTRWARGARYAGSKDRAAVRDHVFQALRCRRSYACLGGGETGRHIMIGALRAAGEDPADLFTGQGHAPPCLTDEENTGGCAPETDSQELDLPDWLIPEFQASLGVDAAAAARALQSRAPVILRVNTRMKTVRQAIEILRENGIEAEPCELAPTALHVVQGARRIATSAAYKAGIVELQDGSSQAAVAHIDLTGVRRGLDYCAGGGGKVLALAARSDADWSAHDADARRMADLPQRAARAGAQISVLPPGSAAVQQPFDLVLCDVPCSGSGTWRRSPDAKWRLTPERLHALVLLQADILAEAAALVRPGGLLAYATCSVLRQENEEQIAAFLQKHQGWALQNTRRWPIGPHGDGFFLAQLRESGSRKLQP